MDKQAVITEIDELIAEGNKLLSTKWDHSGTTIIDFNTYVTYEKYQSWRRKGAAFLKLFLPEEHEYVLHFVDLEENYFENASTLVQTLENVKDYIEKGFISFETKKKIDVDETLDRIFWRFHKVVRQLRI